MHRRIGILLCLGSMAFVGCGGPKTAPVKGQVTLKNKPVPDGSLIFLHADGWMSDPVQLADDGSYLARAIPVGKVQVAVTTPSREFYAMYEKKTGPDVDPETKAMAEKAKKLVPVPETYKDPKTSGLTYEVHAGENTYDIKLP